MTNKLLDILYFKNTIVHSINELMYQKGWTIKQLSEKSELPNESVKKLVGGRINNPTIYTLIKISTALDCSLDSLINWESLFNFHSRMFPKRTLTLLREIADLEMYLAMQDKTYHTRQIPIMIPTGVLQDGMIFDSANYEPIDISKYMEDLQENIMCGFKISGTRLHPTYLNNDILLISQDRYPQSGENGIFLIGKRVYLRTYIHDPSQNPSKHKLLPVNGYGSPIEIENIHDIHFFGRVVTVLRI